VTPVGQPNPDFTALLGKVRGQVKACDLQEAILVDDHLDIGLTETRWIEAVGRLKADDAAGYEKLRKFINEKGTGKLEELPGDEILDHAVKLVASSASQKALAILSEVRFREAALGLLASVLDDVGLKPVFYTRVTTEDPPRSGKLYFLDYRMQGDNATAGMDASRLLTDIVRRGGEAPPPAAVLMSRGQDTHPTQSEWELVAQQAGFYRFNFRYLGKEKLEGGKMPFLFFLHELLASLPLGKAYYSQLKKLKETADTAASAALAKIRQLSPTEFSIFAGKHLGDGSGRRATRHVLELFLGLLDAEVKDSEALESSFREFAAMLKSTPMLATTDSESHTLHHLHTQLLYDRSRWVLQGPIEFGDIYHKAAERDVYYLVLTPECDLELRYQRSSNTWAPKAEDVLLLRGEVKNEPPDKTRGDVLGKPFIGETAPRWIWWMMRKRVIVMATDLTPVRPVDASAPQPSAEAPAPAIAPNEGGRYKKWGQLRQLDAEEIQQRFVSDLASVGTDQVSGMINLIPVEVWHRQQGHNDRRIGDLVIVEMPNPNDEDSPYWAFGEGCEPMLCPETPGDVNLTFAELLDLRNLQPKTQFVEKCKKKKLHVRPGERFYLVLSQKSVPGDWKPPAPVQPVAQAEPPREQRAEAGGSTPAQPPAPAEFPPPAESKGSDPK
jgi:hypothetical protein